MKYNFDTVIDRRGTNSVKWDLGEQFVKSGFAERFDQDTIAAFTADMDFRCAQPIIDAIKEVADHGIFGYTSLGACDAYYDAVINWFKKYFRWDIKREWIVYMNGTVSALKVVCFRPEGTYIMWLDFRSTGYSPEDIRKKIYQDANVLLESGRMFDPEGGGGFERICVPMSRIVLQEAFIRIKAAFDN